MHEAYGVVRLLRPIFRQNAVELDDGRGNLL